MKQQKKMLFIIIILASVFSSQLYSQNRSWNAILNITPFPSPYTNVWEVNPGAVGSLTIFNNLRQSTSVRLRVTLMKEGTGVVLNSLSDIINIPSIPTVLINNTKIIKFSSASYSHSDLKNIERTGRIPEGHYTLCIDVEDVEGKVLVKNVCSDFTIVYPDPPHLVTPFDADSLESNVKYPVFQWTPVVVPADYQLRYSLRIVEILNGQTPLKALDSNIPQYENDNIFTTTLIYPISALPLDTGKTYAWQVQVLDQFGFPPTQNNGKSEIFTFNYKHQKTVMPLSSKFPVSFKCKHNAPPPQSNIVKTNFTVLINSKLKIGKFDLTITNITKQPGNDGKFSGKGTIPFPLINSGLIPLKVEFNDAQINKFNEIIGGAVYAEVNGNVNFLPKQPKFNTVPLTISNVQNLKNYFNKYPEQLASNAKNSKKSFDLPIGIDKSVGGKKITIAITGMTFTPKNAAFDAAVEIDLPDATPNAIALGAKNICIDKHISGTLFLAKDIDLSIGKSKLKLKGYNKSGKGTYVVFDNKGFKDLHIQASYTFPKSLLVKKDNVSPVTATITADANSWSNWIGSVKIDPFKIKGLKDFTFIPSTVYYDHSDLKNPKNIPGKFLNNNGSLWHGFFIPQLKIELPAIIKNSTNKPLEITADNLVIDNQGVSVDAVAENILSIGNGSLSGWYYSIDKLSVEFIKNSLSASKMSGRIKLPISDTQLNYSSILTSLFSGKKTELQFVIKPQGNINIPIWKAKMNIDKSSSIAVNFGSGGNYAKADLSGNLSIVVNKPKINFKAIKFQGLEIQTTKPYISVKSFSAGFASPQKSVGGFPVSLNKVKPNSKETNKGTEIGLGFNVDINLAKSIKAVPEAKLGLTIWGYVDYDLKKKRFTAGYDKIKLNSISLKGNIGPVYVKGKVKFYNNTKLGEAIGGSVSAKMLAGLTIKAKVLFGHKNNYSYWYVDGNMTAHPGIIMPGTPLSIFGFGGGAYYNLAQTKVPSPNDVFKKKSVASVYTPKKGSLGFLATIIMGTADGEALQAEGTMKFEFNNSHGFSISKVSFDVHAYLITPLMQTEKSMIKGSGFIYLDFAKEIYTAGFAMKITIPRTNTVINGKGSIVLYINATSKNWHLYIGESEPVNKRISLSLLGVGATAYFMLGNQIPGIPPPNIPSDIDIGSYNTTRKSASIIGSGSGVAFGASLSINERITFLIFYAKLEAGLGFDIAIRRLTAQCSNGNLPGVNGWYAQGQLYAYGSFDAGLHVDLWFFSGDISAVKLDLAAIFRVSGPNPTWFKGWVHGGYSVLDGLIHGEMSFKVVYDPNGKCEPPLSNPLGGIPLISDIKPEGSGVSILSNPEAAFTFPVNKQFKIDQVDNNGNTIRRYFRLLITKFDIYKGKQKIYWSDHNGNYKITNGNEAAIYYKDVAFDAQSKYKIIVSVKAQELKNGKFVDSYDNGKLVHDSKTQTFKTGDCIVDLNAPGAVSASYPFDRQRYLLQKEFNSGYILLSQAIPCLMNDPKYDLKAIFISYGAKIESQETNITKSGSFLKFNIPPLPNATITQIKIVKRPKFTNSNPNSTVKLEYISYKFNNIYVNNNSTAIRRTRKITNVSKTAQDITIYSYFFRTSKFNTLKEKLDAGDYTAEARKLGYVAHRSYYSAEYKIAEGFGIHDIHGEVIKGAPDRYIRPLIYLSEDITKNPWYRNYVEPLYKEAWAYYWKYLPKRTFYELAHYGGYPPTGRLSLEYVGTKLILTDAEIFWALPHYTVGNHTVGNHKWQIKNVNLHIKH